MLYIVISLVDPENLLQQIGTAVFHCISSFILQSCVRHGKQQSIILSPASQNRLNWNAILWDGVLNSHRSYVCLNYFLSKLVEVRGQYLIDVLLIYLHLKIMLHIVIDHLQQIYESTGVIIGTVNCGHLIVNAFALIGDLQSRVGTKHIGKSASRAIIPELVKQLQQPAAVTWDGNIPRSFSNQPLPQSFRIKKRARPEISRSSSSSISSPSNVASASCCSNLLRSIEYSVSSRILRFSRYAVYSTSRASAYSARLGEAKGEIAHQEPLQKTS